MPKFAVCTRLPDPLLPMATCADNSPVMSLNRSLAQGPTAHDDHPFARAKRHQRLLLQELGVRASVSILILVFAEVLTVSLGLAVSPIIRLAALTSLLMNAPWYLIFRAGRTGRVFAYFRMLTDIGLLTFGLYGAGGLGAAPYLGVYTLVSLYAGFVFSSLACVIATTVATLAYLAVVIVQHVGWLPPVTGAHAPDWGVAGFNLLLVNTAGALTALLAEAYRRSRRELIAVNQELERAHGRIVETERLRAIGELASGVAHHLNNLLAVVLGRVQIALRRAEDEGEVTRNLEIAERGVLDAGEVIRRMSVFSRAQAIPEWVPVKLNELAEEVIEMTRPRWQAEAQIRGIEIDVRLEPGDVPPAAGDPAPLREVLMNLIFNAIEALPHGGEVAITTWAEDKAVFCSVVDTGTGMAPSVQKRAMEPFFTTKGFASTGLGLSVAYGIIRRHGGELSIDSVENRGTTVTFRLIAADPAQPSDTTPPAALSEKLRILLIDDDPQVRAVVGELLTMNGHTVIAAGGGLEGLARLDGDDVIDLVLTDLGMPGMTGWDVARAAKARRPDIRVGIITGWGEEERSRFEEQAVADFVLQKPITRAVLMAAIAQYTMPRA